MLIDFNSVCHVGRLWVTGVGNKKTRNVENSTKTGLFNSCMNKDYRSGKIIRKRRKAESLFLHEKFHVDLLYNFAKYH